jgi:hypothetical protein
MCKGVVYACEDEVRSVGAGRLAGSIYLGIYLYEGERGLVVGERIYMWKEKVASL